MLSGPAILRISLLLLVAGVLAGLVQFLLPAAPPAPVAPVPAERPALAEPAPPPETPPPAPPAPQPPPQPPAKAAGGAAPMQLPSDALAFPADPAPNPVAGEAEVARAEDSAGPRAMALVDLNTASMAELNRLQGGGNIGRAIVAKRPYASVDQLLSKRVLSRAVYERVKEQVTVR